MILLSIMANSSNDNWGCGCLFILAILCAGGFAIFEWSESAGYTPHTHTVDMYMKADWLVGENRTCIASQTVPQGKQDPVISSIDCPVGGYTEEPHNMEIKFWGRISRPEILIGRKAEETHFEWRCKREADGFTCYALN